MLVKRNKIFSGYSETMSNGTSYINAQVKQKAEDLGDSTSKYVLDPVANGLETVENLPIIRNVKPRCLSRYKKVVKAVSSLMKKPKDDKNKNSTKKNSGK